MAAAEEESSCGPHPNAQPPPPIAHAPKPTVVISMSVPLSRRLFIAMAGSIAQHTRGPAHTLVWAGSCLCSLRCHVGRLQRGGERTCQIANTFVVSAVNRESAAIESDQ